MQRGVGNINPLKMAKCIKELERIKGIRNGSANEKGNNRIGDRKNFADQFSQNDLSEDLGLTTRQVQNYKSLLNLIPELQDLVETGELKASIGYTVLSKLPKEELGQNVPIAKSAEWTKCPFSKSINIVGYEKISLP
ncbi:MAG: hypothetical protein SOV35_00550 [Clostridium sp.]|nr:hypothetical protein [Clostridium sp.]